MGSQSCEMNTDSSTFILAFPYWGHLLPNKEIHAERRYFVILLGLILVGGDREGTPELLEGGNEYVTFHWNELLIRNGGLVSTVTGGRGAGK